MTICDNAAAIRVLFQTAMGGRNGLRGRTRIFQDTFRYWKRTVMQKGTSPNFVLVKLQYTLQNSKSFYDMEQLRTMGKPPQRRRRNIWLKTSLQRSWNYIVIYCSICSASHEWFMRLSCRLVDPMTPYMEVSERAIV